VAAARVARRPLWKKLTLYQLSYARKFLSTLGPDKRRRDFRLPLRSLEVGQAQSGSCSQAIVGAGCTASFVKVLIGNVNINLAAFRPPATFEISARD